MCRQHLKIFLSFIHTEAEGRRETTLHGGLSALGGGEEWRGNDLLICIVMVPTKCTQNLND